MDPVMNNNKIVKSRSSSVSRKSAPVASSTVRKVSKPVFANSRSGDLTVKHREYINEVAGSVSFAVNTLQINPGLAGVFPWLSQIAQRYESYRFKKLVFHYETESATSATGSVIGTIDYDASDSAPENKTQAMAYRNAVRSPPWCDFSMISQSEDLNKRKSYFVRAGSLSSNQDIKLYDSGNFYLCTQGQAGATNIGELYVEYIVDLMTPQMRPPGAGDAIYGILIGSSNTAPASTVAAGNMPVSVVSSGTTTSITTLTFTQPWQGYFTLILGGTGLISISGSGTANVTEGSSGEIGGATALMDFFTVDADIGETLVITIVNTTITSASWVFGQADV